MSPGWYVRRLSRMSPNEVGGRFADAVRKRRWRRLLDTPSEAAWLAQRRFTTTLDAEALAAVPPAAKARVVAKADELMDGYAEYFGHVRDDMISPDWSYDPKTGRRAPADAYSFGIPYRKEEAVGDIKQLWEPSRHQHLTVLAAAYAFTGEGAYAERVADHLKSWWAANPPMRGVHWLSGIELGIRLLSWVWVRRLLADWPGAPGLFEENPEALHQIWHHQRWLAAFPSRGSSANNHVIAEAAGQLAASCAFPWFPESTLWRTKATRSLDDHLRRNTFDSGLNRELATEYHGLVLELGLASAVEAEAAGTPVPESTWAALLGMTDALASIVDEQLRPPRQGDADDGHGLVLDTADRWESLLATGELLFGRLDWWPRARVADVRTPLLTALVRGNEPRPAGDRPVERPHHFADAGMTILRDGPVWCRCDGGPHGFLSIAAHAHADALSVEVRHNGVDVLADPGTFCYHGEPEWRSYFRSTLGHNTLQLDDKDSSTAGGPFLWTKHARTRILSHDSHSWSAEHDGYAPATHRRSVELTDGTLRIHDEVLSPRRHQSKLVFHLGPEVTVQLDGARAELKWEGGNAVLDLPPQLSWTEHRGSAGPPLGWFSPGFGRKVPTSTLVGRGYAAELTTVLRFG
ncbi:heparinase [Amycolatopsis sp. K13G38]|uniref:Heparinase n=1 Tax=Amycolatopsis acididurans TaxID=2724524 RepID=A0ABX1J7I7_9PSEU|nr:alginate lyase family protein [Amycolatopsis acididurans]NKQ55755.1 heparinase [Amycolatopsis acididurans]